MGLGPAVAKSCHRASGVFPPTAHRKQHLPATPGVKGKGNLLGNIEGSCRKQRFGFFVGDPAAFSSFKSPLATAPPTPLMPTVVNPPHTSFIKNVSKIVCVCVCSTNAGSKQI